LNRDNPNLGIAAAAQHPVAHAQQQVGMVSAVLAGDSQNQRRFPPCSRVLCSSPSPLTPRCWEPRISLATDLILTSTCVPSLDRFGSRSLCGWRKGKISLQRSHCRGWINSAWRRSVTARKDDAPAAYQAAITNVADVTSFSGGGGLIQTTSG